MENLNREAILRMLSGKTGNSSSGGGGGDIDLAGYATSIWVTENFVSIDFFRELFRAYDSNSQEIMPNDTTSVVNNIKAMVGTWTEQYLTALGNAGGGGGGGGGAQYLNDLLDVQLTTPLTDGQALVYNATLQKWVNGAAGVNMTTIWNALAGSTNEQINASHLSTALSGYVTTSDISDMATQTWVGQQGFATQTWVTSNFITIAYFDRLFRAYNNSTLVSHNDTTTTIDNIKAMFGFWTDFYLSALGTGGVSSVSISLSQLADVNVAGVTNNQFLGYDSTNSEWVNTSLKTINGNSIIGTGDLTIAGVSSLSSLTDVALSSPTTYQVLMYDASTTKWYNSALKTINGQPLYGSGDISVGGGASGNYLPLSGGTMVGAITFNTPSGYTINFPEFSIGYNIGSNYYLYTTQSIGLALYTSGQKRINILPNGNVGINMENPLSGLDIYRDARAQYLLFNGVDGVNSGYVGRGGDNSNNVYLMSYSGNPVVITTNSELAPPLMYLTASQTVGICTTSPRCRLDIGGPTDAIIIGTTGYYTPGTSSARFLRLGLATIGHTGSQYYAFWVDDTTAYSWLFIGYHYLGTHAIGIRNDDYVHFGASITADGGVTALSDIRHKTIIRDTDINVEQIARMPAVMYKWNDGRKDKGLHVGSIAQDWQTVLPEVVLKDKNEEGTLSMQYGVAALVSSIIIARKVVNHEERIEQLEKENKELKKRLNIA